MNLTPLRHISELSSNEAVGRIHETEMAHVGLFQITNIRFFVSEVRLYNYKLTSWKTLQASSISWKTSQTWTYVVANQNLYFWYSMGSNIGSVNFEITTMQVIEEFPGSLQFAEHSAEQYRRTPSVS